MAQVGHWPQCKKNKNYTAWYTFFFCQWPTVALSYPIKENIYVDAYHPDGGQKGNLLASGQWRSTASLEHTPSVFTGTWYENELWIL